MFKRLAKDFIKFWTEEPIKSNMDLYETDLRYDEILNAALDKHGVTLRNNSETIYVGEGMEIWVANYPYAYGYLFSPKLVKTLPTLKTRKRIKKMVEEKVHEQLLQCWDIDV